MKEIQTSAFEKPVNGKQAKLIQLHNGGALQMLLSTYGARIVTLHFSEVNVVVSFDKLEDYFLPKKAFHGATIGRYANRIKEGKFSLDGTDYTLPVNNGANHLHGGPNGFFHQVWDIAEQSENSVRLRYFSKAGEEGYPGNVTVTVVYTLTSDNELLIEYSATTDEATPFNITNHAYFNLNGGGTALNHLLQINADHFTAVDETLIPKATVPVEGTAFDFREAKPLGKDIDKEEEQTGIGGGYDHNFVLNKNTSGELSFAAKATGDKTGIIMETFTEEPGIQLFSGNFAFDDDPDSFRTSFCLETQHFPDSPNQPDFPSTILQPGDTFSSKTVYKFSKEQ